MGKYSKSRGNVRGNVGIKGGGSYRKKKYKKSNMTDMNMKQVFFEIGKRESIKN